MRRVLALSLLLSGFVSEAYSQTALKFTRLTGYAPPAPFVPSPTLTVAGDFDGDGVTDIAVAGETVAVVYGPHDPLLAPAVIATPGTAVLDMVAGDFDGDGRTDLTFVTARAIFTVLSRGRSFSPPRLIGAPDQEPLSSSAAPILAAGDLNGDGRADLVVTGRSVRVLLSNGEGSFRERMIAPPASSVSTFSGAAIGDFDDDGKPDIALTATQLAIYPGNGDGTFRDVLLRGRVFARRAIAIDLDGDGRLDLFLHGPVGSEIRLNDGAGQFHDGPTFPQTQLASMALADLDGDGMPDAVGALSQYNLIVIRRGIGGGRFGPEKYIVSGRRPGGVLAGDFDGNGSVDIAAVTGAGSLLFLFAGSTDFTRRVLPLAPGFTAMAAADFNSDGKPDIAVLDAAAENVAILQGQGDGTFRPQARLPISPGAVSLEAVDFNNDRRPDLAVLSEQAVEVFLNRGDGTFAAPVPYGLAGLADRLLVVDVNRDGKPDLLATGRGEGTKTLLIGTGDGKFSSRDVFLGPPPLAVADFNGDGIPDLISWTTEYEDAEVVVAIPQLVAPGLGDGTFGPVVRTDGNCVRYGDSVYTTDLDGDGITDFILFIREAGFNFAGLRFGSGNAKCTDGIGLGPIQTAVPPALTGDWDQNGTPDLAFADRYSGLFLELAKPGRQFEEMLIPLGGLTSAVSADWNGDGKPDFAVVDSTGVVTSLNQPK